MPAWTWANCANRCRPPPESSPVWDDALRLARLYDLIYTSPKPTLAVVQGPAVAGGAGLVTVCDLALATAEARFGYPEVRRGLVAAMVMPHLLRHVGERLARYLLLTGEMIDAAAAAAAWPDQRNRAGRAASGPERRPGSFPGRGGPEALARTKTFLHQFSRQALSIEDAAKGSAAPRLSQGVPGRTAGVLRQEAGAVGAVSGAVKAATASSRLNLWLTELVRLNSSRRTSRGPIHEPIDANRSRAAMERQHCLGSGSAAQPQHGRSSGGRQAGDDRARRTRWPRRPGWKSCRRAAMPLTPPWPSRRR